MTQISTKPPSGTRDFLPNDMQLRQSVFQIIKDIYRKNGFLEMETPSFENIETLTGKYGEEGDKLIFKIMKRGEKEKSGEADFALRYDLTVPLMRFYARHQSALPKVFKRFQIGPVWRADRPGRGRFREFYQCDVDILGSNQLLSEYEVISTLAEVLDRLGLEEYCFKINSRALLFAWLEACGIPEELKPKLLISFDKMDKIGLDGVLQEIGQYQLAKEQSEALNQVLASDDRAASMREFIQSYPDGQAEIEQIDQLLSMFEGSQINFQFDPLLARGLDYYTGIIFEIETPLMKGSIGSGGRADNLSGLFLKQAVPLFGGSLGIERILLVLEEQGKTFSEDHDKYYVTLWDQDSLPDSLNLLKKLRAQGKSAEIDLTGQKLKQQLKLASELGYRYCLIQGPDEKANNQVTIKDMKQGTQELINTSNL